MMDILTPKGQETRAQEKKAIRLFTESFPAFEFVETAKDEPADIDGFIVRPCDDDNSWAFGQIVSGVEIKCRNMTAYDLRTKFDNRWLITSDKIDRGIAVCRSLCVDFRGFLYLVPDRMLYIVPIWTVEDGFVADVELDQTETQANVNGGTALRLNAYVDVSKARVVAEL